MTIALLLEPAFRTTQMWLNELAAAMPGESVVVGAAVDSAVVDVAIVRGVDPGNLHQFPNLALIHCMWAGVDKLMDHPDVPVHVPLVRTVDPAMADQMAATAVAHVLDVATGHHSYRAHQTHSEWKPRHAKPMSSHTVGVLGYGTLGRRCGEQLAHLGFNVMGWRSSSAESLTDVLGAGDIILNLLPLTSDTVGILNVSTFAHMQPGATFINLARGQHVVDSDLIAALDSGHLSRAILDVFHLEPLPSEHPFWKHPQITVTPHVAAETDPHTAAHVIAANVRAFRSGRLSEVVGLVDRSRGY
jgi:glyoxylate/hydroxypyruvate reductase